MLNPCSWQQERRIASATVVSSHGHSSTPWNSEHCLCHSRVRHLTEGGEHIKLHAFLTLTTSLPLMHMSDSDNRSTTVSEIHAFVEACYQWLRKLGIYLI